MNEQYQEQEQEQPMPGTVSMSSTTGITKPVTRKRGMHVNPQFVRAAKIIEDGIIHLVTVIENRWKEMVVMGKISQEFVDVYKERWSEIFDDDFIYLIFFNVFKSFPCTVISNIIKQQCNLNFNIILT